MKKKIFISFDYENDKNIKGCLEYQLKSDIIEVAVTNKSIEAPIPSKWKDEAKGRISECNFVIFLCGKYTDKAAGVSAEMTITRNLKKPYFLLCGRKHGKIKKPSGSLKSDKVYKWTPDNIKKLLNKEYDTLVVVPDSKIAQ